MHSSWFFTETFQMFFIFQNDLVTKIFILSIDLNVSPLRYNYIRFKKSNTRLIFESFKRSIFLITFPSFDFPSCGIVVQRR